MNELARLRKLNSLEKPKALYLAREEFTAANELLTPTFKLKRNVCKRVYQAQIDRMYAALWTDNDTGAWIS